MRIGASLSFWYLGWAEIFGDKPGVWTVSRSELESYFDFDLDWLDYILTTLAASL